MPAYFFKNGVLIPCGWLAPVAKKGARFKYCGVSYIVKEVRRDKVIVA